MDSGFPELVARESWARKYKTAMGRKFERINTKDVFRMGEKNFKTITYKKVPIRVESHQKDL